MSAKVKHCIPQATNIPYQPLLIKPIFSILAHTEKQFFHILAALVPIQPLFTLSTVFATLRCPAVLASCKCCNTLKLLKCSGTMSCLLMVSPAMHCSTQHPVRLGSPTGWSRLSLHYSRRTPATSVGGYLTSPSS